MLKQAVLALLLFNLQQVFAQTHSIYQNIASGNGLPSNYVFCVAEDENGFLWAGTDKGLCRYDGFRWQVWDKDNGLSGNYINQVLPDRRGGLWLAVGSKGFFHFYPQTGRLRAVGFNGFALPHTVQTDPDGNLYAELLSSSGGGYLVSPADVEHPQPLYEWKGKGPVFLRGNAAQKKIFCVVENRYEYNNLLKVFKSRWPLQAVYVKNASLLTRRSVYYLSDSVAVTNADYFLFGKDGQVKRHHQLFSPANSYAFTCATQKGLYVYDIKTGYYFIGNNGEKAFFDSRSGLGTDYVNHIYQTADGTLVISTLGAGLQLIKSRYRKTFGIASGPVRTLVSSGKGWYALSGDNLFKIERGSEFIHRLGETSESAFSFCKTGDTLIVGGIKGLLFLKEEGSAVRKLGAVDFTAGISSVIKSEAGYAAGTYGGGLLRFAYGKILRREEDYPLRIVEGLVPLRSGWAALSYEDGLWITEAGRHRQLAQKDGLLSNSVYSVHSRNDTLWIGTKGGVAVYGGGKILQRLPFARSGANDKALACFHDAAGRLWAVSGRGLCRLQNGVLQLVGSHPLVANGDAITAAVYNGQTGELAVGTNKTISVVDMAAVRPVTAVATPRLAGIWVNDAQALRSPETLPYDVKSLRFALAPHTVSPFLRGRFYYRLDGLSDGWTELKDSLTFSFPALRPGTYALQTKAVNADGYESRAVCVARFAVQKPFWQRWPFLLLAALAVAVVSGLLVLAVYKARQRRREAALRVQRILQAERERIAKDLHDHLGTNLTTIIAQTDNIETRLHRGDVQHASHTVQRLSAQTRETMNVLRETIWAVQETEHPMEEFVLRIRTFLQRFFEATAIAWEVKDDTGQNLLLTPAQTLHLFRIVQEASQNILKHAGATSAVYRFWLQDRHLLISVEDNGRGSAEPQPFSNGLANIRERALRLGGVATVRKKPSVMITVKIPVQLDQGL